MAHIIEKIISGDLEELQLLLNPGNVNNVIHEKNGYTALHLAFLMQNEDLIKFLVNIGANPLIKTRKNQRIFDFVGSSHLLYIVEILMHKISEQKKIISNYESRNHLLEIERLQSIVKSNLDTISHLDENAKSISEVLESQSKEIRTLKRKVVLAEDDLLHLCTFKTSTFK